MPIDYKKYPKNWKSEIRPQILERAKNKCEFCGVENHAYIFRGIMNGVEVYQNDQGYIFNAENSKCIDRDYFAEIEAPAKRKAIKVVLTIAHLDHNIANNNHDNLRALCQRCHNKYDSKQRAHNRKNNGLMLF